MKRDAVLRILAAHRDELRREYGVKSLALFGSEAEQESIGVPEGPVRPQAGRRGPSG